MQKYSKFFQWICALVRQQQQPQRRCKIHWTNKTHSWAKIHHINVHDNVFLDFFFYYFFVLLFLRWLII